MFRQIIALLIAAMLVSGPVAAWSTPCPAAAPAARVADDCATAMVTKREQPAKQCVEHCAALAAAACVLPTVPASSPMRTSKVLQNLVPTFQLSAIAVELNTPPPRTIA